MARYTPCAAIPMAGGDPQPAWIMPGTRARFATWSLCGGRPFACEGPECARWHAGVDLVGAKDGALVVTPEEAEIVKLDAGWSKGSKAVFLRTSTGLFLVLGGTKRGSGDEWGRKAGDKLKKGDPVGRVLGSYGMIHFETYVDDGRNSNSRWFVSEDPPDGLRNPLNYIERASGQPTSFSTHDLRQQALLDLGYDPDPPGEPWGEKSIAALKQAQDDLGLEVDGKWGPRTEARIQDALDEQIEGMHPDCDPDDDAPCQPPTAAAGTRGEPSSDGEDWNLPLWIATGAASLAVVVGGVYLFSRRGSLP